MIKVIASDLDGTLLGADHRISHRTAETIRKACAAGYRFIIATGREFRGAIEALNGEELACDYILCSGAELRNEKQETLFSKAMDPEDCRKVFEILNKYEIRYLICGRDAHYCIGDEAAKEQAIVEYLFTFRQDVTIEQIRKSPNYRESMNKTIAVESFEKMMENSDEIRKFFIFSLDLEMLGALKKDLLELSGIDVASSFYNNLEVSDIEARKGPVLKNYIESLGYTMDEVMVFGDSLNDYSMLAMDFGATVAVDNADPEIKKISKYVTKANTEDGVAWTIEELMKKQTF